MNDLIYIFPLSEETPLGLELRPVYSPEAEDPGERLPEYLENKLLRSLASLARGPAHVLLHLRPRSLAQVWAVQETWPPSLVIFMPVETEGEQTTVRMPANVISRCGQ